MDDRAGALREYERWLDGQYWMKQSILGDQERYGTWGDRYDPELVHRWRVTLECGCTTEALTLGADHPPTEGLWQRLRHETCASRQVFVVSCNSTTRYPEDMPLYEGRLWCADHDTPLPWREITEWIKRTEKGYTWTSATSGKLEHHGPCDRWAVRLSCGHRRNPLVPVGWLPEHGHKRDPEKAQKVRERMEGKWEPGDFLLHWIEQDCPDPMIDDDCNECAYERRIVSYEPIGRLTWPGDSARPSREALKHQLDSAQSRVHRLMAELADAEAAEAKIREELQ